MKKARELHVHVPCIYIAASLKVFTTLTYNHWVPNQQHPLTECYMLCILWDVRLPKQSTDAYVYVTHICKPYVVECITICSYKPHGLKEVTIIISIHNKQSATLQWNSGSIQHVMRVRPIILGLSHVHAKAIFCYTYYNTTNSVSSRWVSKVSGRLVGMMHDMTQPTSCTSPLYTYIM